MRPSSVELPVVSRPQPGGWSLIPELDLRSIGLFRIVLGLNLIFDLLWRKLPYVTPFYSDRGVVTRHLLDSAFGSRSVSVLSFVSGEAGVYAFFAITLALYVMYTAGFHSRIVGVAAYVCLWSIHQRNPFIIYGVDFICNALLFFSLFLPLDARFALKPIRGAVRVSKLAAAAMLLQISFIYFVSGVSKRGSTWSDGSAISLALTDTIHATVAGAWLLSQPLLCRLLTWATLVFEWLVPLLIFFPVRNAFTRSLAVAAILAFNWGLAPFLHLGPFYLTALAQAAVLLPAAVWERVGLAREPRASPADASRRTGSSGWHKLHEAALALAVAALIWSNTFTLVHSSRWSEALERMASVQRVWPPDYQGWEYSSILSQNWAFFAPDPSTEVGWMAVTGQLEDGEYMELHAPRPLGWRVTPEHLVEGEVEDLYGGAHDVRSRPKPHDPKLHSGVWKDLADGARRYWREPEWVRLLGQWAIYEADVWDTSHPERPLNRVDLVLVSVDGRAWIRDGAAAPTPYVLESFETADASGVSPRPTRP